MDCHHVFAVALPEGESIDMAYACLSANEGEHHMSTMSIQWKRMVMSRPTKTWAQSVWTGPPLPEEAEEDRPRTTALLE